jgi:hypothetical protein
MKTTVYLGLAILALGVSARADILELKNGNVLNGKYAGGTAGTIRFELNTGLQVIETSQVIAITFTTTGAQPTPAAAATPAPAPAPVAQPKSVTLPAGTMLLVRMTQGISSKNAMGTPFTTKLEYDLAAGGTVAVKGGTVIHGKVQSSTQARRAVGKSTLDLRLTQMVINGQPVPILTSGFQEAGPNSIKKAASGAAIGAAIGAIADGGDGAATGAAIGATASLLKKGQTVTVPPNTLIEFTLQQPVTLQVMQ